MKCPNCGFDNRPKVKFCEECGTKLTKPKPVEKRRGVIGRLVAFTSKNPWRLAALILFACMGALLLSTGLDWLRFPVTKSEAEKISAAAIQVYYPELANIKPLIQEVKDENGDTLLSYFFYDEISVENEEDYAMQFTYGAVVSVNRTSGLVQLASLGRSSDFPASIYDSSYVSSLPTLTPGPNAIVNQPATPTQASTSTPAPALDRCKLFDAVKMEVVWLAMPKGNTLAQFYVKMAGGIPGLEKGIPGDDESWDYSAEIGDHETESCKFTQGYKERLYCEFPLPSGYSNTVQSFDLYVSGCGQPIYSDSRMELPAFNW